MCSILDPFFPGLPVNMVGNNGLGLGGYQVKLGIRLNLTNELWVCDLEYFNKVILCCHSGHLQGHLDIFWMQQPFPRKNTSLGLGGYHEKCRNHLHLNNTLWVCHMKYFRPLLSWCNSGHFQGYFINVFHSGLIFARITCQYGGKQWPRCRRIPSKTWYPPKPSQCIKGLWLKIFQ